MRSAALREKVAVLDLSLSMTGTLKENNAYINVLQMTPRY